MSVDEDVIYTEFLVFTRNPTLEQGRKTKVFNVISRNLGNTLGVIKWYRAWRQYVFYPETRTLFNTTCLQHITAVTSGLNNYHQAQLKKKKGNPSGS